MSSTAAMEITPSWYHDEISKSGFHSVDFLRLIFIDNYIPVVERVYVFQYLGHSAINNKVLIKTTSLSSSGMTRGVRGILIQKFQSGSNLLFLKKQS